MKNILFSSILLTSVLSADEIPKLNTDLIKGTYSFTGKVTTIMGNHNFTKTFSGETSAKGFKCSWVQNMGTIEMKGSVAIKGDRGVVTMQGEQYQESNADLAIASATGVSGGSAHLMYSLWTGKSADVFPEENIKTSHNEGLTTVTGDRAGSSITVVLKNDTIVSIRSIFDPKKQKKREPKEEITDEQIREILKMTNKEITPESILEMKQMLIESEKSLSKVKDVIDSTTVFTVKYL